MSFSYTYHLLLRIRRLSPKLNGPQSARIALRVQPGDFVCSRIQRSSSRSSASRNWSRSPEAGTDRGRHRVGVGRRGTTRADLFPVSTCALVAQDARPRGGVLRRGGAAARPARDMGVRAPRAQPLAAVSRAAARRPLARGQRCRSQTRPTERLRRH